MTRAIRETQRSEIIEADAKPLAMFFFQKAFDSVTSLPDVEKRSLLDVGTCLRSLVRQLSWNSATSEVQPVVENFYNGLRNQRSDDSALTAGECVELLKDLVSDRETYIMIDAVDECKDPEGLLRKLKELALLLNKVTEHKPLHLMLCSRDDLPITVCFPNCLTITTSPAASKADQTFYIESEIDRMNQLEPGSLFFSSTKLYNDRLKKILIEKSDGLFRWTQIQIEIFTKWRRDEGEVDDEFDRLKSHTTHPELNKEYARLLDSLKERSRKRAMKMLRLVSCCIEPLTAGNLAEAITASEHGMNRPKIKADDVRRILVGFISEYRPYGIGLDDEIFLVRLAHASVVEYLADEKSNVGDFSPLALHSEAASLCFASISQGQQRNAPAPALSAFVHNRLFGVPYAYIDFFNYSCFKWPQHCQHAFKIDGTCDLVRETSSFILSKAYLTWNSVLREVCTNKKLFLSLWMDEVRTSGPSANPGFAIAAFNLTELLEIPEIREIVDLRDVNGRGCSLLNCVDRFANLPTIECFAKWYPEQIQERFKRKYDLYST